MSSLSFIASLVHGISSLLLKEKGETIFKTISTMSLQALLNSLSSQ